MIGRRFRRIAGLRASGRRSTGRRDGGATVEFAIIAPILIIGALGVADIGLSIHQSFEIDQALRNGAEAAVSDPGEARVSAVLAAVDDSDGGGAPIGWTVDRFCACPEATNTEVDCFVTCQDLRPTAIFYSISGARDYAGVFLPPRTLNRSAVVQVR